MIFPKSTGVVESLRAFAKLYGYVRFFHPSDEASEVDWDRFAVYGAGQAKRAKDTRELKQILERLFLPLAPTLQLFDDDHPPLPPWFPEKRAGLDVVAWRHRGVGGLTALPTTYVSLRSNRSSSSAAAARAVRQWVDARPYACRKVRLSACARTSSTHPHDLSGLWLSAVATYAGLFPLPSWNLVFVPIRSGDWRRYEAEALLPPGTVRLAFGAYPAGAGTLWVDDFELAVQDTTGDWRPIQVRDAGFEEDVPLEQSDCWEWLEREFEYVRTAERPHSGRRCLKCSARASGFLGGVNQRPDEYVDRDLGGGLWCRLQLTLYSDAEHTLGPASPYRLEDLSARLPSISLDTMSDGDVDMRLAGVTIIWNVLQHFYPYFDVVNADWDRVLTESLARALTDRNVLDFLSTLTAMAVALKDGHAAVQHALRYQTARLSCRLEMVEGRVVVVASRNADIFQRGDILLELDGVSVEAALAESEARRSGSPHSRRARALLGMCAGNAGDRVKIMLLRDGQTAEAVADFIPGYVHCDQGDSIRRLDDDIWFVDLNRATMPEIDSVIDDLARARGVVFDLRDHPRPDNYEILCHLLAADDPSDSWLQVPCVVYPDREGIAGWEKSGWHLKPKPPRITGKVVFLTSSNAISYAESIMGFVEGFRLGEIVGQPTAGTNGDINLVKLPGGFLFSWTETKVLKHDGSQHHLIGIRPTVPLDRTIKAVREGRDEYIERAVELIKGRPGPSIGGVLPERR